MRDRLRAGGMVVAAGAMVLPGGVSRAGAGDEAPAERGVEAEAAFAKLEELAGTWTVEYEATGQAADFKKTLDEHKTGPADHRLVIFKLTGAGSALVEAPMPGGAPHEMLSVYHPDGDDPRMTHSCAARNQPRMKLDRAGSAPDLLIFTFDGGTNLDPKKDMHIHGLEITFHEDGRVTAAWQGYLGDKSFGKTLFIMTRRGREAAGHRWRIIRAAGASERADLQGMWKNGERRAKDRERMGSGFGTMWDRSGNQSQFRS